MPREVTSEAPRGIAMYLPMRTAVRFRGVTLPVVSLICLALALPRGEPWRIAALSAFFGVATVTSLVELALLPRSTERALLVRNAVFSPLFFLVGITLTGGLRSPLASLALPISFGLGMLLTGTSGRLAMIAVLAGTWGVAAFAYALGDPATLVLPMLREPGHAFGWITAVLLSIFAVIGHMAGRRFRRGTEQVAIMTDERNRAILEGQKEQTRALVALSSEIAHELKNPLATVKGLAALVAKDTSGKAAERVAVLRREIDRMQGVLDELLNFSRPTSALAMSSVSPHELLREVARLHEGMAASAGVVVTVDGKDDAEPALRCDRRKVLQVLVNLVQNAIDASPRGGHVRLRAAARGGDVVLEIEDEGAGIAEDLRARLFEPGVSSKATGSGLGLTVARALARQHGGDVTLERAASRTVAALALPAAGPPDAEASASSHATARADAAEGA